MTYVMIAARVLIALVFCASAVSKVRDRSAYAEFRRAVRGYGLPRPVGIVVIGAEFIVPLSLVAAGTVRVGYALAAGLLVAFCGAIAYALRRGLRTPCRCFGRSDSPPAVRHLARNALLAAVALGGLAGTFTEASGRPHPAGLAVALAAGTVLAVLVVALDDLVELFTPRPLAGAHPDR